MGITGGRGATGPAGPSFSLAINPIAIGIGAGTTTQSTGGIAIGQSAGYIGQSTNGIAIGNQAAYTNQGGGSLPAIAIGTNAGKSSQGSYSVAIGENAGYNSQQPSAISIGPNAGYNTQDFSAIAIGSNAGYSAQNNFSIAIGYEAGKTNQGNLEDHGAIAIGKYAGQTNQGQHSIAIGNSAGSSNQGVLSIAIGTGAAAQGTSSIVIGNSASDDSLSNAIVLNATGMQLVADYPNGFHVKPIREAVGTYYLEYNSSTGEITYSSSSVSDGRLKTDIADTNLGLEFIKKLHPVSFRWKDKFSQALEDAKHPKNPGIRVHEGFIAQEVKTVLDSLGVDSAIYTHINDVESSLHDIHGVRKEELIAPLVKAIQEQDKEIQTLKSELTSIKQTLALLVRRATP
jgi:hypothetical protein